MPRKSLLLLLCVLVLFVLGLSMVFNTTSAEVLDRALDKSTHHAVIKQLLYAVLAGLLAAGVWFLGFEQILRLSGFFLGFVTFLLILVFIPGIGQCLNGAHRWLAIGSYSFQPSELAKYLIPLYYIYATTTSKTAMLLKDFLKLLLKLAVPMGLILIEPDNGTVAIILSSLFVLFLLTKIRWVYWVLPLLVILVVSVGVASQMPHVHNRIEIYLHPEMDQQGKGHQPH
ncbi:MAG TPA: FtsW/RodA/SpoVE family cell cycle protein, partial [Rhabdochlamydiaceae bacterium]|nr:FtsW/RodA/SpoVE family cell cycle protein [Rhabdochlamydiaceae bacterium]